MSLTKQNRSLKGRFTVANICAQLIELEREHALYNWCLNGVYIWPILRMPIYYELTKKLGVFGAPHTTSHWKGRRLKKGLLWAYAFINHSMKANDQKDLLIFEHPRKVLKNDFFVDVYTDALIQRLHELDCDLAVYENLSYKSMTHSKRAYPHDYYDPIITFSRLTARFRPARLSPYDHEKVTLIEQALFSHFKVEVNLQKLVSQKVREFQESQARFRKLLQARAPKAIVVVVSYSHQVSPLIAAAKSLNIHTIEIQHGTFSPYHMGYHFPDLESHPYFCDTFLSFGPFWHSMAILPIGDGQIKSLGFPHLNEQLMSSNALFKDSNKQKTDTKKHKDTTQHKDNVLFLSQGVIGAGLAQYACTYAHSAPSLHIQYKLHPSEYMTWRTRYTDLAEAADANLIEVIDHHKIKLYDLMRAARFQVGVFSTAVYEGMALGCHTLLVDLPGIEYMDALIEQGFAEKISSAEDLCKRLAGEVKVTQADDSTLSDIQQKKSPNTLLQDRQVVHDIDHSDVFAPLDESTVQWLLDLIKS